MGIKDSSKNLAKGAGIAFIGMCLGKGISYIYTLILSRIGPEDFGLFNLALAIIVFISTLSILGLRSAILRYVPYYRIKNDNARVKGVLLSSLLISLFISMIFTVLVLFFAPQISYKIFNEPNLSSILRYLSITIIFSSLSNLFIAAFAAFKKVGYTFFIKDFGETFVEIIFLILFFILGYRLSGAIAAYIISITFTFLLSFYVLEKKVFPLFKNKIKPKYLTKEMIFYSLPLIFTEFLVSIINWISTWILGIFRNVYEVGIYNIVTPTVNLLVIVPTALMTLYVPLINEAYSKSKGGLGEVKKLAKVTSHWVFLLNFPISIFLFVFSKEFLGVLFKSEYTVGALSLSILSISFMIFSLSHTYNWILIMLKKTKIVFTIMLISAIINTLFSYILIKPYGYLGAAIAASLAFIILTLIYIGYCYVKLKLQILRWKYFKIIFSAAISAVVTYIIPLSINSIITLIAKFIIFGVLYLVFLYLMKSFQKEDKEIYYIVLKKIKSALKI